MKLIGIGGLVSRLSSQCGTPTTICGLAAFALLASAASAQTYDFGLDQPASLFTFGGTSSLGPIEGNPSNQFNLAGSLLIDLSGGPGLTNGQFTGGIAAIVPDIHAKIPNPVSFLPDLAIIDITGVTLTNQSDPFSIAANGDFTAFTTLTILTGTVRVAPLVGSTTVTSLAGTVLAPTNRPGNISYVGNTIHMTSAVNETIPFSDAGSGVTATITLIGDIVADFDCPAPMNYCVGAPNSVGAGSSMDSSGTTSVLNNDFVLNATGLPTNQSGLFFYAPNQAQVAFGNGFRCVAGSLVRLPVINTGIFGSASYALDYTSLPAAGSITGGSTWNFQFWYRDPAAGGAFFNLSDGLSVFFCP